MNRLREAAQQALEAMDELHRTGDTQVFDLFHRKTTEALRAALAESVEPTTAWAHLPNAGHIDRIVAHAKEHPRKWTAAWDAAWDADGHKVWEDALSLSWAVALRTYRDKAWDAVMDAAMDGAWESLVALIAWDDAGELLSQPIDAVKAKADEGNFAAILIYPAMLAMKEEDK